MNINKFLNTNKYWLSVLLWILTQTWTIIGFEIGQNHRQYVSLYGFLSGPFLTVIIYLATSLGYQIRSDEERAMWKSLSASHPMSHSYIAPDRLGNIPAFPDPNIVTNVENLETYQKYLENQRKPPNVD